MVERQFDRMISGKAYKPDAECAALYKKAAHLAHRYTDLYYQDSPERHALLAELFGSIGENVEIRPSLQVDYGINTVIGDGCFFNYNTIILDVAPITFGSGVLVGPNCQFLTLTHPLNPADRKDLWEGGLPITIGDNVWFGGGVTVLPGINIGEHSVIGGGAVVTKDIPAHSVAVGNPAKIVKTIDPNERPINGQFSPQDLGLI